MSAEPVTAESVEPAAGIRVRRARTGDVPRIQQLVEPLVMEGILLGKDLVVLYENVQEFRVAVDASGEVVGCGALHVMWEDLGEIRPLAAAPHTRGTGVGHALLERLEDDARELGLSRLFCLTLRSASSRVTATTRSRSRSSRRRSTTRCSARTTRASPSSSTSRA